MLCSLLQVILLSTLPLCQWPCQFESTQEVDGWVGVGVCVGGWMCVWVWVCGCVTIQCAAFLHLPSTDESHIDPNDPRNADLMQLVNVSLSPVLQR